jgi:inorganic pyrophosphatase
MFTVVPPFEEGPVSSLLSAEIRRPSSSAGHCSQHHTNSSIDAVGSKLDAEQEFFKPRRTMGYEAVIEIPRGSRNKYEVDHVTGRVHLDRVLFTPFVYPVDYGFFDKTLGGDGDPLDALVLLEFPVFPGVVVDVRPVGVLPMEDDGGIDEKVVCVQTKDPRWAHIQDINDVPEQTKNELLHFFSHYKDLEPGKWVKVGEWQGKDVAERLIKEAQERYLTEGDGAKASNCCCDSKDGCTCKPGCC